MTEAEELTVRDVIALAESMRAQADVVMRADVYASPYYPTTAQARYWSQRLGPGPAMDYMRNRAAESDRAYREEAAESDRTRKRHERRQAATRRDASAARSQRTLGERLDRAILGLRVMSEVAAAVIDADPVAGDKPASKPPKWVASAADEAREDAHRLVAKLEHALDHARGLAGPPVDERRAS